MEHFPSKPYVVQTTTGPQSSTDIDQMFRELYDAGAAMNDELIAIEDGSTGSGGITIAQVMARVVVGI